MSEASVTEFLERSVAPWYGDSTLKDAVLNLLVFLLVFVVTVFVFLVAYNLSLVLVPGGKGLIFANPYAGALLPGLLVGLVAAQFRAVRRPGLFPVTWVLLASGFFLLLTLSLPVIQGIPSVRPADAIPLVPNRFLPLADGSSLLTSGTSTVLIPRGTEFMSVASDSQFDPMNQRFVFSSGEPKALGSTGPEKNYYQYTPALASLQTDFLAIYDVLRDSFTQRPTVFWLQAATITWLFLGMFFLFSLKTWPLVHVVLVLSVMRLILMFLVYAFRGLPALVDLWAPVDTALWLRIVAPLILVGVASAALFFMTWLAKPWKQEALT